jgi:hypothetical protein
MMILPSSLSHLLWSKTIDDVLAAEGHHPRLSFYESYGSQREPLRSTKGREGLPISAQTLTA